MIMERVTPQIAGRYLKMGTDTIRYGLQSNIFPFGKAIKMPSGRWVYDIRPALLIKYKKGELI